MRLLLDSHAVYWWVTGSNRFPERLREWLLDRRNVLLVSAVSIYELSDKARLRRLDFPTQELRAALGRNAVETLPVTHDHAEYAAQLDWAHRDPWDRLLASQALLENCTLLSADRFFDETRVERAW